MATRVIMPKQGLQMTEGTITKWLFSEGDNVRADEPLFEMETDKLNIEIAAPQSGTLLKIIREVGDTVPITELIAVIGEAGEDISLIVKGEGEMSNASGVESAKSTTGLLEEVDPYNTRESKNDNKPEERVFITPRGKMKAEEKEIDYRKIKGSGPDGLIIERDVSNYVGPKDEPKTRATPLAGRIADMNGVSLAEMKGSGVRGKIMKADVEAVISAGMPKNDPGNIEELMPFTGMRKVISERMMQSLHGTAQANHRMKVDMSEAIRFREKMKADNSKVSFTDILVKVVSKALTEFPGMNSSLTERGILLKSYVNMGLAVAVDNGLIVPVIKNSNRMSLNEISSVTAELIKKAQNGGLTPDEYTGGTFTITNLGMFDIDEFTAILNSPESGILAIGKIDRVPVVEDESIIIKPMMVMSLTYDHRIIDGAPAAKFLQRVKQLLQNPYLLV